MLEFGAKNLNLELRSVIKAQAGRIDLASPSRGQLLLFLSYNCGLIESINSEIKLDSSQLKLIIIDDT